MCVLHNQRCVSDKIYCVCYIINACISDTVHCVHHMTKSSVLIKRLVHGKCLDQTKMCDYGQGLG